MEEPSTITIIQNEKKFLRAYFRLQDVYFDDENSSHKSLVVGLPHQVTSSRRRGIPENKLGHCARSIFQKSHTIREEAKFCQ